MIKAGELRHRITIEQPVKTQDAVTGDLEITWTPITKLWASVEYLSARDLIAAQSQQSKIVARIKIRPFAITYDMRILFKDKIFSIEGILPDKDSGNEYLTIPVSEGVRHK